MSSLVREAEGDEPTWSGQVESGLRAQDMRVVEREGPQVEVVSLAMCVAAMGLADVLRVLLSRGHLPPRAVFYFLY